MSEPTRPIDALIADLRQALALADALDDAGRGGPAVDIENERRYEGQGALDRLGGIISNITATAAVAQAISLAAIADRLEHIGTVLEDRFARTDATAGEPPPPVTVSGCCKVPLGEPHAADCRWADGRHRP